jgi:6-phosphogluconolactonase (cycloisomerase 2 family)
MTIWNVVVGTFTKEFADIFHGLRANGNSWERSWVGGGTASSGWKPDGPAYQDVPYAEGVERLVFDDASGDVRSEGTLIGDVVNPQYVTHHPHLPVVYVTEYSEHGRLLAVGLSSDGTCGPRSAVPTLGRLAIAAAVHPAGSYAYVAHWGDGTLTAVPLDGEGGVLEPQVVVRGDADPEAPNFSRHHQVRVTPTGNAVIVSDIGRDELTVYSCDRRGGVESTPLARIGFPPRSGPRHVEFHPSGRWVYVVPERESSLYVLEAEDGIPIRIAATYPTVPVGFVGTNRPSELSVHPNGRWLYVGGRGFNSITAYSVDHEGGAEVIGYQESLGRSPSAVHIDPTGRYLLVGNVMPGNVAVFVLDENGVPRPAGDPVEIAAPRSFTIPALPAAD